MVKISHKFRKRNWGWGMVLLLLPQHGNGKEAWLLKTQRCVKDKLLGQLSRDPGFSPNSFTNISSLAVVFSCTSGGLN